LCLYGSLDNLGWIDPTTHGDLQVVTKSGKYTVYPLERAESSVKALRINLPDPPVTLYGFLTGTGSFVMNRLYVHYRSFTGFDDHSRSVALEDGTTWYPPDVDGALVHAAHCLNDPDVCNAVLLDMHPGATMMGTDLEPSYIPNRSADSFLYLGESHNLAFAVPLIETTEIVDGVSLTVRLGLGEAPTQVVVRAVPPPGSEEWDVFFDWTAGSTQILFDDRFSDADTGVDVYEYKRDLRYNIVATKSIVSGDCPAQIDLEAFESYFGGGPFNDWNHCNSGPLQFSQLFGDTTCSYYDPNFSVQLWKGGSGEHACIADVPTSAPVMPTGNFFTALFDFLFGWFFDLLALLGF